MKTARYWERTALLREIAIQDGATYTAEEVIRLYSEALDDIEVEIKKIVANFQRRFGIDNETAEYFLTQAQEDANTARLLKALEQAPTQKARDDILEYIRRDGLSARAYTARRERYRAVEKEIYARIKAVAADAIPIIEDSLKNAYMESYYGMIDDIAEGLNVGINFSILNDRAINAAVSAKWHGERFSERIWKHTDKLAEEAQALVVKALMSGEAGNKTAAKLAERFEVNKFRAVTLVRTETAHIHQEADFKAYEDLEIKKYKYLATLDYATCELCQPLDGRTFNVSDRAEGVNAPVMHPRCRCTTTFDMNYVQRRARDPLTGRNSIIDGNVTYSQWKESLTTEQKSALDLAKKKNSNRTRDKLQHTQYQKVLGRKVVPQSFDKFQELKYNDKERWGEIKNAYRYINANPGSDINAYRCVQELKALFPQGSFHIPAKEADTSKLTFDDVHINQQRKHNVSENEAKRYIKNAKASRTVWKGQFERYYSYDGVAFVSKDEMLIRTAFSKRQFNDEVEKIVEVLKKYGY